MIRVESRGSIWLIDETGRRYCRFPKQERPRAPEHNRGVMEDAVWHPFTGRWRIGCPEPSMFPELDVRFPEWMEMWRHNMHGMVCPGLVLWLGDGDRQWVWAPNAEVVG